MADTIRHVPTYSNGDGGQFDVVPVADAKGGARVASPAIRTGSASRLKATASPRPGTAPARPSPSRTTSTTRVGGAATTEAGKGYAIAGERSSGPQLASTSANPTSAAMAFSIPPIRGINAIVIDDGSSQRLPAPQQQAKMQQQLAMAVAGGGDQQQLQQQEASRNPSPSQNQQMNQRPAAPKGILVDEGDEGLPPPTGGGGILIDDSSVGKPRSMSARNHRTPAMILNEMPSAADVKMMDGMGEARQAPPRPSSSPAGGMRPTTAANNNTIGDNSVLSPFVASPESLNQAVAGMDPTSGGGGAFANPINAMLHASSINNSALLSSPALADPVDGITSQRRNTTIGGGGLSTLAIPMSIGSVNNGGNGGGGNGLNGSVATPFASVNYAAAGGGGADGHNTNNRNNAHATNTNFNNPPTSARQGSYSAAGNSYANASPRPGGGGQSNNDADDIDFDTPLCSTRNANVPNVVVAASGSSQQQQAQPMGIGFKSAGGVSPRRAPPPTSAAGSGANTNANPSPSANAPSAANNDNNRDRRRSPSSILRDMRTVPNGAADGKGVGGAEAHLQYAAAAGNNNQQHVINVVNTNNNNNNTYNPSSSRHPAHEPHNPYAHYPDGGPSVTKPRGADVDGMGASGGNLGASGGANGAGPSNNNNFGPNGQPMQQKPIAYGPDGQPIPAGAGVGGGGGDYNNNNYLLLNQAEVDLNNQALQQTGQHSTRIQIGMMIRKWIVLSRIGAGSFGETFCAAEVPEGFNVAEYHRLVEQVRRKHMVASGTRGTYPGLTNTNNTNLTGPEEDEDSMSPNRKAAAAAAAVGGPSPAINNNNASVDGLGSPLGLNNNNPAHSNNNNGGLGASGGMPIATTTMSTTAGGHDNITNEDDTTDAAKNSTSANARKICLDVLALLPTHMRPVREVCIKVEQDCKNVLRLEVQSIRKCQECPQVVRIINSGHIDQPLSVNYLVMERLGPNLADLRRACPNNTFDVYTSLKVGISCLRVIRSIHDLGLTHRDIKPSNFVVGLGPVRSKVCYLIDFGLARRFRRSNGQIRPARENTGFRGTNRYASIQSHKHCELGRVDDLWSLLFMLVEMVTGSLPWRKYKDKEQIGECKMATVNETLVQEMPREFTAFLQHLQSLSYESDPNYDLLIQLLEAAIVRRNYSEDRPLGWERAAAHMLELDATDDGRTTRPIPLPMIVKPVTTLQMQTIVPGSNGQQQLMQSSTSRKPASPAGGAGGGAQQQHGGNKIGGEVGAAGGVVHHHHPPGSGKVLGDGDAMDDDDDGVAGMRLQMASAPIIVAPADGSGNNNINNPQLGQQHQQASPRFDIEDDMGADNNLQQQEQSPPAFANVKGMNNSNDGAAFPSPASPMDGLGGGAVASPSSVILADGASRNNNNNNNPAASNNVVNINGGASTSGGPLCGAVDDNGTPNGKRNANSALNSPSRNQQYQQQQQQLKNTNGTKLPTTDANGAYGYLAEDLEDADMRRGSEFNNINPLNRKATPGTGHVAGGGGPNGMLPSPSDNNNNNDNDSGEGGSGAKYSSPEASNGRKPSNRHHNNDGIAGRIRRISSTSVGGPSNTNNGLISHKREYSKDNNGDSDNENNVGDMNGNKSGGAFSPPPLDEPERLVGIGAVPSSANSASPAVIGASSSAGGPNANNNDGKGASSSSPNHGPQGVSADNMANSTASAEVFAPRQQQHQQSSTSDGADGQPNGSTSHTIPRRASAERNNEAPPTTGAVPPTASNKNSKDPKSNSTTAADGAKKGAGDASTSANPKPADAPKPRQRGQKDDDGVDGGCCKGGCVVM